jgi:isoleucyl-tRNA synthetase
MLGTLAHDEGEDGRLADMPELERLMLHRLAELDEVVRKGYDAFDFKRITRALIDFMGSSCPRSISTSARTRSTATAVEHRRKAAIVVVRHLFDMPRHVAGADAALHHGRSLARPPS